MASAESKFDDFCFQCIQLTHSLLVNYWICLHSFTDNELEVFSTALGGFVRYWNFAFIVSELVQVNPNNSLAMNTGPARVENEMIDNQRENDHLDMIIS